MGIWTCKLTDGEGHRETELGYCFVCSVEMIPFGPIMPDADTAEAFLAWLDRDPGMYARNDLIDQWAAFLALAHAETKTTPRADSPSAVNESPTLS